MLIDITKKRERVPDYISWCKNLAHRIINENTNSDKKYHLSQQQISLLQSLHDNKLNIIKSYRCAGVSMLMRINTIYNILYGDNEDTYKELYIYQSSDSCQDAMRHFLNEINFCDETIYLLEKTHKSLELMFENKKAIIKFVSQGCSVNDLSERYNNIDIDNAAWITNDHVINDVPDIVKRSGSNVTIASCPNKESGFFYELWDTTIKGRGKFKPISLKWYLDPRFNEDLQGSTGLVNYSIENIGMICEALEHGDMLTNKWYEEKKAMLGESSVREIDGDFLGKCAKNRDCL